MRLVYDHDVHQREVSHSRSCKGVHVSIRALHRMRVPDLASTAHHRSMGKHSLAVCELCSRGSLGGRPVLCLHAANSVACDVISGSSLRHFSHAVLSKETEKEKKIKKGNGWR